MIIWIIGMSGAGKTVIGKQVHEEILHSYPKTIFLDGDVFRSVMGEDLGHTIKDREKNAGRFSRMCCFLDEQGFNVICSILSIFPNFQKWNRENLSDYFEVYLEVPFEELVRRDSKGLYQKALKGQISNVVGVDIDFTPPINPDLTVKNDGSSSIEVVSKLILQKIPMQKLL